MRLPLSRPGAIAALLTLVLAVFSAPPAHALTLLPMWAQTGLPKSTTVDVALPHGHMAVHTSARPTYTAIIMLHGYHAGPATIEQQTGWSQLADLHAFTVVYPDANNNTDGSWNAGACCGTGAAAGRDDVDVIADTVAWLRSHGHSRIFLAGFSNGGMMVYRIAATRPDLRINGYGAVGGAYEVNPGADAAARFRLRAIHGTLDRTVPLTGLQYSTYLHAPLRSFASARWLLPRASLELHTFTGGHVWPRRSTTSTYDATNDLFAYFADRTLFP